jgi:hypothetical protein
MITREQEEELDKLILENNPVHPNFNPSRSHQEHIMKLLFMKNTYELEPCRHNPRNVSAKELGDGYRFLSSWEMDRDVGSFSEIGMFIPSAGLNWVTLCEGKLNTKDTYRVPASEPISPRPQA